MDSFIPSVQCWKFIPLEEGENMEILITIPILIGAIYIVYKNIKKSSNGECNCGTCSKNCPVRKEK